MNVKINLSTWFSRESELPSDHFPLFPPEGLYQAQRPELFSAEQMESYGEKLAKTHKLSGGKWSYRLLQQLADNELSLTQSAAILSEGDKRSQTPAAVWLLDNFYIIEEQIRLVRHLLPAKFGKGLPMLEQSAHYLRIQAIAEEMIRHSDGRLETSVLLPFIAAYQRVTPLLLGELWAMPAMLRFALINNLARIAAEVARVHQERNKAEEWITDILATAAKDAAKVILVIADMARQNPQISGAFVAELERRLSGQNNTLALTWVEQQLESTGRKTSEVIEQFNRQLALSQLSVSNTITGLRQLGEIDWQAFVESVSLVERILQQDPAGTYPLMHFDSRDDYRHVIERLARHSRFDEREVARTVLDLANQPGRPLRQQHVGYFLLDKGYLQLEQQLQVNVTWLNKSRQHLSQTPLLSWLGSLLLLTIAFSAEMLVSTQQAGIGPLLWLLVLPTLIVSSQLALQLLSELTTRTRHPLPLPRLDYAQAIPPHHQTLVVIPCLLSSNAATDALLRSLEICYLGNALPNIGFALLTDFTDSAEQNHIHDEALIRYAVLKTEALNRRYSGRAADSALFSLLHRDRTHNISQGVWMGYERKRGKIHALNRWLQGEDNSFSVTAGASQAQLHGVRYVITLDSDTILPRETAHKLIGVMAHPLNAPVFDTQSSRVVEGYAILQPRLAEEIPVQGQGRYARLCSSVPGNDAYSSLSSDIYQDLFGEGSFVGKGIYDVAAFSRATRNTCPENLVLSHDLLEGCYARSGVVSNVVLYEQYPTNYLSDVARRFRWVRGDWQLLNWLRPQVRLEDGHRQKNPLSPLSRWKLIDNLRRSLVAPALLALVFMLCTLVPNPAFWAAGIMLFLLLPGVPALIIDGVTKSKKRGWRQHLQILFTDAFNRISRAGLALAVLPHESYWSLKAIVVTLWRLNISHRYLNEWKSASASPSAAHDIRHFYRCMWINPLAGVALVVLTGLSMPALIHIALALALLWAMSPALLSRMSQPVAPPRIALSAAQQGFLRRTARETWAWFSEFASDENNHLPPDNLQEIPQMRIAHRTSPTNIGLSLLANLTAWDFGYVSQDRVIRRSLATLDTLDRMEHFRGHLYNWYDTQTLQPLNPRYVSSVDSGNMAAHLVTLQAGLAQWKYQPVISPSRMLEGLRDTLLLIPTQPGTRQHDLLADIDTRLRAMAQASPAELLSGLEALLPLSAEAQQQHQPTGRINWPALLHQQLDDLAGEWRRFFSWVSPQAPFPAEIPSLLWLAELCQHRPGLTRQQSDPVVWAARERMAALLELDSRLSDHARMDFRFLYFPATSLLSVGYNIDSGLPDASKYDLFPSEVRLTHYFAISANQLPAKSWFVLGRLFTRLDNQPAVMSWSGSMFEYLMPHLVMPVYPDTLLEKMALSAVRQQIRSAKATGTPWGVSESGYAAFDVNHNYQYRAFGTPELGLKRGLNDDRVVAPYASLLALMVLPQEATDNLLRLKAMGARGEYGYYEALDFTADRLAPGQPFTLVKSYMAHHQAMGFLALSHLLLGAPMVARFISSALFQSSRLLLQETVPDDIELYTPRRSFDEAVDNKLQRSVPDQREFSGSDPRQPQLQLLSNANYHLMVTHSGAGYSLWKGLALTRWRADSTSNHYGTFCYVTDHHSGDVISHSYQPICSARPGYKARFNDAGIEFDAAGTTFSIHTHIVVSPEDDVEIRRITVTNRSRQPRRFDITSYAEVVLAPAASDMAHPAFSNLFVQTEILPGLEAILAHRRPREEQEVTAWMFHAMAIHGNTDRETTYETDRARFLGRGNSRASPQALKPGGELTGHQGAVLDPLLSIRQTVALKAGEAVTIDMLYGVTPQRDTSIALIGKYRNHISADRVFELAWSHSQVALRQLNIRTEDTGLFNQLASALLFPCAGMRGDLNNLMQNRLGQESLWRHAISGDLPILLVRIGNNDQLDLVTTVIQAHQYWRQKGLTIDLVIMNSDQGGYQQNLYNQLTTLIPAGEERQQVDKPGGIFIRKSESFSAEDLRLLLSVAAVVLEGRDGSLADQLSVLLKPPRTLPAYPFTATRPTPEPAAVHFAPGGLQFFNGYGGFSADGREYHIILSGQQQTPAPWSNVLANSQSGSVISESGQAYSWYENAHEYRLTPWHNDPVSDSSGEALYLRDEESGDVWSPTPLPIRGKGDYLTRHGFGYSGFDHTEQGISSTLTVFMAEQAPVRLSLLTLSNQSGRTRNLSITGYVEWVLGELASRSARHVVTSAATLASGNAVLAKNFYHSAGSARTAFFAVTGTQIAHSGNRLECLGRNGTTRQPAMMNFRGLSGNTGAGLDPCAALQTLTTLIDGDSRSFVFALGVGEDETAASALMQQLLSVDQASNELAKVKRYWQSVLTKVQIQTPEPAVDLLVNGWLLYQTLASRLLARSGYYQSGGAYGFRDQLQDTLALTHAAPQRLRDQLLLCASRQFIEGDVQHWWHPPGGRGVRTRCSDDYLWLPYALCHYVEATEDMALLSQPVSYLEGRLLAADEESVYELPGTSKVSETLWQHAVRAVKHALRFGQHGLPLMGSGDWNDGMSTVGIAGKGESVWLGFFLYRVLTRFAALAVQIGDNPTAALCQRHAQDLKTVLNVAAWDGEWYLRGFFDSGQTLGSHVDPECRIDAIAQSWSVLSGAGEAAKSQSAMNALFRHLVDPQNGLIKLLTPPFDGAGPNPGYIRGYLPGVRENGGQYTHGALWAIMAFAARRETERAWSLFSMINPVNHSSDQRRSAIYKVEPYVMAADVYAAEGHSGRGGWTWYTGSSGWAWQLITESLLGITRRGPRLSVHPQLPAGWREIKVVYREGEGIYNITVSRGEGEWQLWLDGERCEGDEIVLESLQKVHQVVIHLPAEKI